MAVKTFTPKVAAGLLEVYSTLDALAADMRLEGRTEEAEQVRAARDWISYQAGRVKARRARDNTVTLWPLPSPLDGDHMTLEVFDEHCENHMFLPSDGSGYYATKDKISDCSVWASRKRPTWATHVVWLNK